LDPVSPLDPIDYASLFKEGHLPSGFILLLYDGNALRGPLRFTSQREADNYLILQPGVKGYLVIPKYDA